MSLPVFSRPASSANTELKRLRLQIELERAQTELARVEGARASISNACDSHFSLSNLFSCTKLFPAFNKKHPDIFFVVFERTAKIVGWPRHTWPLLLQHRLVAKVQRAHAALWDEVVSDYDTVMARVLEAYALVPEAYRKKFRELRLMEGQTHFEFPRAKRVALTHWFRTKMAHNFDSLCELILLEELFSCVPRKVASHLSDRSYDRLEEAATRAD